MLAAGRMSAFVPLNVPIAAGLLMSTSMAGTAFFQWLNQVRSTAEQVAMRSWLHL